MSRYTGSSFKQSRRVNFSLSETGKELAKKPFGPGQHGKNLKRKVSEYGVQLTEKQKVKFMYGLTEKQFRRTFDRAAKMKGVHGENLLKLLESRLDNVVFRMGLATSRRGSRQIVNHGHILVNGKKVDIASFTVTPGDVISVKEKALNHPVMKAAMEGIAKRLDFVTFDDKKMEGTFVRLPDRSELNPEINESLIVEFYNR